MNMARCLLFERKFPNEFWAKVVSRLVYLLDRLPSKAVKDMTLFEAGFGNKPFVS